MRLMVPHAACRPSMMALTAPAAEHDHRDQLLDQDRDQRDGDGDDEGIERHLHDVVGADAALEQDRQQDAADAEQLHHLRLEPLDDGGLEGRPQVVLDAVERRRRRACRSTRRGARRRRLISASQAVSDGIHDRLGRLDGALDDGGVGGVDDEVEALLEEVERLVDGRLQGIERLLHRLLEAVGELVDGVDRLVDEAVDGLLELGA